MSDRRERVMGNLEKQKLHTHSRSTSDDDIRSCARHCCWFGCEL
jgi:hypothetical protein